MRPSLFMPSIPGEFITPSASGAYPWSTSINGACLMPSANDASSPGRAPPTMNNNRGHASSEVAGMNSLDRAADWAANQHLVTPAMPQCVQQRSLSSDEAHRLWVQSGRTPIITAKRERDSGQPEGSSARASGQTAMHFAHDSQDDCTPQSKRPKINLWQASGSEAPGAAMYRQVQQPDQSTWASCM
jgi:hypothetical protein